MQSLMGNETKKWHLYIIITISSLSLYVAAWASIIWQSLSQQTAKNPDWQTSIMLFGMALVNFVILYVFKRKRNILRWGIVLLLVITAALSVQRYLSDYLLHVVNSDYMLAFRWQQIAVYFALYILGICFVWFVCKNISAIRLCLYGFVLGCCLWVVGSGLLVYTGILYTWWTMIMLLFVIFVIMYIWRRPKFPDWQKLKKILLYSVIFINVCLLLSQFKGGVYSYDSFRYLEFGYALGQEGGLISAGISGYMASAYSLVVPAIDSLSIMFNYIESNSFLAVLFVCFIAIFSHELYTHIRENGVKKMAWLPVALAVILMLSTGIFVLLGLWHLNNGPAMVILFLLAITLNRCVKTKDSGFAVISGVLMAALIYSRVEMPLYCILIIIGASTLEITKKQMAAIFIIPFLALAIYYSGFFIQYGFGVESDFLSIGRAIPIIWAYLLVGAYLLVVWRKYLQKLQKYIFLIILVGMVAVFVLMSIYYPSKSIENLSVISGHMLFASYSGYTWHVMIGLLPIVCLIARRNGSIRMTPSMKFITITFAIFILDIFLFRDAPLSHGEGDSGSRLIASLFPFVVFWLFTQLAPLLTNTKIEDVNLSAPKKRKSIKP